MTTDKTLKRRVRARMTETAARLIGDLGVPGWWAQSVAVYYQRSRGLRLKHQQAHGFTVSASKTIGSPIRTVFEAFTDDARRGAWLVDGAMDLRTSRSHHPVAWAAPSDLDGGPSRLLVSSQDKGSSKTTVTVSHEGLPVADEAESAKTAWRRQLVPLKALLAHRG